MKFGTLRQPHVFDVLSVNAIRSLQYNIRRDRTSGSFGGTGVRYVAVPDARGQHMFIHAIHAHHALTCTRTYPKLVALEEPDDINPRHPSNNLTAR